MYFKNIIIAALLGLSVLLTPVLAHAEEDVDLVNVEAEATENYPSYDKSIYGERVDVSNIDINVIEYVDFIELMNKDEIDCVFYNESAEFFYVLLKTPDFGLELEEQPVYYSVVNPKYETFRKELLEKGITVYPIEKLKTKEMIEESKHQQGVLIITVFSIAAVVWGFYFIYTRKHLCARRRFITPKASASQGSGHETVSSSGKKTINNNTKKFSDVAGLIEVKKDVSTIVDFMKNRDKYIEAGAKLPRGILFYGPSGTGKTLLAKAIAGEAGVPFLAVSASEFVNKYVGVGAQNIRDIFNEAAKVAPCIVFIDEIDAVGKKRGDTDNDEYRNTLNQLLTVMDGFNESSNILVIGATNRIKDIDTALLRPGRFTEKFCVPLPETPKERLEIINLYAKNKKFDESVSLEDIAKETSGFSPAELENLLNEAAIISVQRNQKYIDKTMIDDAMFKVLTNGHAKHSKDHPDRRKDEIEIVSWHEAGHTLMGMLHKKDVTKVTILSSTSGAGGATFTTPEKENLLTIKEIQDNIMELYAGRAAEFVKTNDKFSVTTGASNDIERATAMIKAMVADYGMTEEFGMLNLSLLQVPQEVLIKKETTIAKEIEMEAKRLLKENYKCLEALAAALRENETLYRQDIEDICKKYGV